MQKILGYMRKAVQEFGLLSDGDRIAVGVSGGKDSLALLFGLALMRRFIGIDFDIIGVTLDPCFGGVPTDYSPVAELCERSRIDYRVIPTHIGEIVFDIREEDHPCSLCARMRRGALHNTAKELGCNKVALGHNYEDVLETFIMNLFTEGRIGCFAPMTYLDRKDITVIRPLVFAPENEIRRSVNRAGLPVVKSKCPVDGTTNRERTKNFINDMERSDHGFKDRIFGALRRSGIDGWGGVTYGK
ncbi:MAG: tRNA 2-thiocytidine biosynthesis protein TtcA [Ruminococcus sp.]|nr:tRNA 2-thiocytidine biosynthesis protein TtcA [Ruminococcus sp.]